MIIVAIKNSMTYMSDIRESIESRIESRGFFFNWDSLHARLNSHYKAWSHKKKKHKNIKAYRKSVQKKSTIHQF